MAAPLTLSACGSSVEEAPPVVETLALGTVVDVGVAIDGFATLLAALIVANLVTTLSGGGPFTVFAATDDAFAALPAGVSDALLLPENKAKL
jgi:uncharacterized surface protein with fasciclin (FAS1) repeats